VCVHAFGCFGMCVCLCFFVVCVWDLFLFDVFLWRMNRVIRLDNSVYDMDTYIFEVDVFTDGSYVTSTRAHTHTELIREWVSEPKNRLSRNRIRVFVCLLHVFPT